MAWTLSPHDRENKLLRLLEEKIAERDWTIVALKQEIAALKEATLPAAEMTTREDIQKAVALMEERFEANSGFFYSQGGAASCFNAMRSALKTISEYLTEDEGWPK